MEMEYEKEILNRLTNLNSMLVDYAIGGVDKDMAKFVGKAHKYVIELESDLLDIIVERELIEDKSNDD